jgi:hypothetical protein
MSTGAQRIQCSQKHKKLIVNQFRRSKVIACVGELLTRRWNAWLSERQFSQLAVKGLKNVIVLVLVLVLFLFLVPNGA